MYKNMRSSKLFEIKHESFTTLINPSFESIDNAEDMDAILARTHLIVITDSGVYWRVAGNHTSNVKFIEWPHGEPKDLLAPSQQAIFQAYRRDPHNHKLPESFHADMVWSQEVLSRLFRGETLPRTITMTGRSLFGGDPMPPTQIPPRIMDDAQAKARIKKEKVAAVFRGLKRTGPLQIELDSPSPEQKRHRDQTVAAEASTASSTARASTDAAPKKSDVPNPEFPGLDLSQESGHANGFPAVGEEEDVFREKDIQEDDLEKELERLMDETVNSQNTDAHDLSGGTQQEGIFRNVCGVKVLQWFGLPVTLHYHGPHRVSELNSMIENFHVQFTPVSPKYVGVDGMYLCHRDDHFTGIWCREGFVRCYDNGDERVMSMGELNSLAEAPRVTIFRLLQRQNVKLNAATDVVGGSGGVCKRPAACDPVPVLTCPLTHCVVPGCTGTLMDKHDIEAICYDMPGPRKVVCKSKECTSRNCRANYSYNFRWSKGKKINVLRSNDLADGVLFVNSKKCFSLTFLKYHEELLFRGQVSSRAIEHAYKSIHADNADEVEVIVDFRKCYQSALFYFIALREFEGLGSHMSLVIDDEINTSNLEMYQAFCHSSVFPPSKRANVKFLVGDGHLSLKPRCADGPVKRAGRPRSKSKASSSNI